MVSEPHREEVVLVLLSSVEIPLDAQSIATRYGTSVEQWSETLERLERNGYVRDVGDGLYRITPQGRAKIRPRGGASCADHRCGHATDPVTTT